MKHQLRPNMVVKETTLEERIDILVSCEEVGINCDILHYFINYDGWHWKVREDDRYLFLSRSVSSDGNYVSAEEFLQRVKGEFVEP